MEEQTELTDEDLTHLRRCVELAREALAEGDEPFGSVLVDPDGAVLHEDRNRTAGGDQTRHPELELARWAAMHVEPEVRPHCTVYTSGEHCPMCATAHAWAGLGRIVAAASAVQLAQWRASWGLPAGPVRPLPVTDIVPGVVVIAPVPPFDAQMRDVHARAAAGTGG
jgi:tRNA(Arg) A34 adenosine deaminase TadA